MTEISKGGRMAFGRCFSCVKYSVFVFNFLLWLLGCSLLAVGTWLLMDDNAGNYVEQLTSTSMGEETSAMVSYAQVTDSNLSRTLAYLFIAFGLAVIFVAFVGCCGAVRENQCMLGTFFISLVVLFVVLLGIGIWAFVARNKVDAHTRELQRLTSLMLKNAVNNYYSDPASKQFMDKIQKKYRCCGAQNAAADYRQESSLQQPPCEIAYQLQSCVPNYFVYVGDQFEDFMRGRLLVVGSVAIAIAICLVLGMIGVVLLGCAVKERRWNTNAV